MLGRIFTNPRSVWSKPALREKVSSDHEFTPVSTLRDDVERNFGRYQTLIRDINGAIIMPINNCTEDFEVVSQDPAKYYRNPSAVADDPQLSSAERLRLLDEWHIDISRKLSSDEEGMTPPHARDSAEEASLLEEIACARGKIESTNDNEPAVDNGIMAKVSRFWNRI